jgi:hypothetical protein
LLSIDAPPHKDNAAVPVVGAVHENHTSFVIPVCPKKRHPDSLCPCEPVLAVELLNANVP